MTADNPAARVDLDALGLTEAERAEGARILAQRHKCLDHNGPNSGPCRTDRDRIDLLQPWVERILADRLAPLLAERDEARAERAKAWDEGWDTGQLWAFSDLDKHDRSTNPYRAALADPEAS